MRTSGQVACWGRNDDGQADAPSGDGFTGVFAAQDSSCALDEAGAAACWGATAGYGEVAPAGPFVELFPSRVDERQPGREMCGLRVSGEVVCWSGGVVDDPGVESLGWYREQRDRYAAGLPVSLSWPAMSCTADASGVVLGCEFFDEYGWPWEGDEAVPEGRFVWLAVAARHACAVRDDGRLQCWGWWVNNYVPWSRPRLPRVAPPVPDGRFVRVEVFDYDAGHRGSGRDCAQRVGGAWVCWHSRTGEVMPAPALDLVAVRPGSVIPTSWGTRFGDPCGLTPDGREVCWDSRVLPRRLPRPAIEGRSFEHQGLLCGTRPDEVFVCWDEQLAAAADIELASASLAQWWGVSCGIDADGLAVCWSNTRVYELPVLEGRFVDVSAYGSHVCAVAVGGALSCVTTYGSSDRAAVSPPGGEFVDVEVSGFHGCALGRDGAVVCWGDDVRGYPVNPEPFDARVDLRLRVPKTDFEVLD